MHNTNLNLKYTQFMYTCIKQHETNIFKATFEKTENSIHNNEEEKYYKCERETCSAVNKFTEKP